MTDALEKARHRSRERFGVIDTATIETFVRAIILDAREAKAEPDGTSLLQPNDGERYDVETPPHVWSCDDSRVRWKNDALMLREDVRARDARIAELEREAVEQQALLRKEWARNEKAEAALAELQKRVEKAADELLFVPANSGSMKMPEARAHVLAALKILVPSHPLLSFGGEAKGEEGLHGRLDDLGSVQDGRKMSTDGQPGDGLGTSQGERLPKDGVTGGESAATSSQPPRDADPVPATVKGEGFNREAGGFALVWIDGQKFDAQYVARVVLAAARSAGITAQGGING